METGIGEFVEAARMVREQYPGGAIPDPGASRPREEGRSPSRLDRWKNEGVVEYLGTASDVRPFIGRSIRSPSVLP